MSDPHSVAPRRIAIVAVHGVGDQKPNETAFSVANLLLNLGSQGHVLYTPFSEREPRIAVRRVDVTPPEQTPATQNPFDERGSHVRQYLRAGRAVVEEDVPLDHVFMHDQLSGYQDEGPDATYETVRLEGARLGPQSQPTGEVHLYEMYWADLSRLGTGALRILSEFYQLLFHLGRLGRITVDFARLAEGNAFWWRLVSQVQAGAVWWLTLPIPILSLYLLAIVLLPLIVSLPAQPLIAIGVLAIALVTGIGWLMLKSREMPIVLWLLPPLLFAALVALVVSRFRSEPQTFQSASLDYQRLLALEWCAVTGALIALLMRAYTRTRPGAGLLAAIIGGLTLAIFAACLFGISSAYNGQPWEPGWQVTWAAMRTVDVLGLALFGSWIIFNFLGMMLFLVVWPALWIATDRSRSWRAVWTAFLSLALPAVLFDLVSLTIWSALDLSLASQGLQLLPAAPYSSLLPRLFTPVPRNARAFVHALVKISETPNFLIGLAFLAVAALLAIWSLGPVVWAEVQPPRGEDAASARLGAWLTRGYRVIWSSGALLYLVAFAVFPTGFLSVLFGIRSDYPPIIENALLTLGIASAGLLVALRGRLESLALGFRPVLDVLLDVDSYLREHPREGNPRARICTRYASLLRFLCNWTDPRDGGRYKAIILVAHSQGTVITADLLRFLRRERHLRAADGEPNWEATLERLGDPQLPVYFLTVGCPLRQLYSTRFPHLYAWARYGPPAGAAPEHWVKWQPDDIIPAGRAPDPTELGVTRWVNAFRSGDYVGRHLWRPERCDYLWLRRRADKDDGAPWDPAIERPQNVSGDASGRRREFCLGAGAHTHYFDKTAAEVAVELDGLICEAITW